MSHFARYFLVVLPLFGIVLAGYVIGQWRFWPRKWTSWLTGFVFAVAFPAYIFRVMADMSRLPHVDKRLLIAYFGGCFIVYALGRFIAARIFDQDGAGQSIFGMAGVFSNLALLGLPVTRATLGVEALPAVAFLLTFNALTLWTLVTISIEWARSGSVSWRGVGITAARVVTNPLIAGILLGAIFGMTGLALPRFIDVPLLALGEIATPLSLAVVGLGLSEYGVRREWRMSLTISGTKLIVMPLVVYLLAVALRLASIETKAVVLMASCAIGANVYFMAAQFDTLRGVVAGSMVISTALDALTVPIVLALLAYVA